MTAVEQAAAANGWHKKITHPALGEWVWANENDVFVATRDWIPETTSTTQPGKEANAS